MSGNTQFKIAEYIAKTGTPPLPMRNLTVERLHERDVELMEAIDELRHRPGTNVVERANLTTGRLKLSRRIIAREGRMDRKARKASL